jgi:hypothetical protein
MFYASEDGDFLHLSLPVGTVERIFSTKLIVLQFRNSLSKGTAPVRFIRAAAPVPIPRPLKGVVDLLGGLTHLPSVPSAGTIARPQKDSARRLASQLAQAQMAPSAVTSLLALANPTAWRGTRISALFMPRCLDGKFPSELDDCSSSQGLRGLHMKIARTDALQAAHMKIRSRDNSPKASSRATNGGAVGSGGDAVFALNTRYALDDEQFWTEVRKNDEAPHHYQIDPGVPSPNHSNSGCSDRSLCYSLSSMCVFACMYFRARICARVCARANVCV